MPRAKKITAGVQSVETGVVLLRVLAASSGPRKLSDLSAAAGMSASQAHKYLSSFIRCGLVRQSGPSGRYGIGPLAAELGFAALRNMDVVDLAQEMMDDLRDRLQCVVSLAVWANRGPTIVRRSVDEQAVSLVVQLGGVMTMLTSAGGLVYSTYGDRAMTGPLIESELSDKHGLAARANLRTGHDVEALLNKVRRQGFARISGTLHRGIAALSAPVFDYTGKIAAAMTLVGIEGAFDLSQDGRLVRGLLEAASELSRRAGAEAAATAPGEKNNKPQPRRRPPPPNSSARVKTRTPISRAG